MIRILEAIGLAVLILMVLGVLVVTAAVAWAVSSDARTLRAIRWIERRLR